VLAKRNPADSDVAMGYSATCACCDDVGGYGDGGEVDYGDGGEVGHGLVVEIAVSLGLIQYQTHDRTEE
jgi:hypothetical protein